MSSPYASMVNVFQHRARAMRAGLNTANSCWFLLRLCNLSTLIREWTALHAFPSLAFKDVLLSANHAKDNKQALFIPQVLTTRLHDKLTCTWPLSASIGSFQADRLLGNCSLCSRRWKQNTTRARCRL